MSTSLPDSDLSGFFQDADKASLRGQTATIRWSAVRLFGLLAGALGGALSWSIGNIDLWGLLGLAGFAAALVAEVVLLSVQPERDWYAGRALAESAKTLSWRFAVRADPFFSRIPDTELKSIMRERLAQIAEKGKDRITLAGDQIGISEKMVEVRSRPFEERKLVYINDRIKSQRDWYANKASTCKRYATSVRAILFACEVVAVATAGGRAFGAWDVDLSGILAALVASGAAWYSLRQYSNLASAYSVAAAELNLSIDRLMDSTEWDWPIAVADSEEAISREHTMWLASRTGAV